METGRYRGRFILRPKILDPEMGILRRNHKNGAELSPGHPVQEGGDQVARQENPGPGRDWSKDGTPQCPRERIQYDQDRR